RRFRRPRRPVHPKSEKISRSSPQATRRRDRKLTLVAGAAGVGDSFATIVAILLRPPPACRLPALAFPRQGLLRQLLAQALHLPGDDGLLRDAEVAARAVVGPGQADGVVGLDVLDTGQLS